MLTFTLSATTTLLCTYTACGCQPATHSGLGWSGWLAKPNLEACIEKVLVSYLPPRVALPVLADQQHEYLSLLLMAPNDLARSHVMSLAHPDSFTT